MSQADFPVEYIQTEFGISVHDFVELLQRANVKYRYLGDEIRLEEHGIDRLLADLQSRPPAHWLSAEPETKINWRQRLFDVLVQLQDDPAVRATFVEHFGPKASAVSPESSIKLLIDPGSATAEEIGDYLSKISRLYEVLGGPGLQFTMTDVREPSLEGTCQ